MSCRLEQLAEVVDLPDPGADVVVLHRLLDPDRHRLQVATGEAAVGVQALEDDDEVARHSSNSSGSRSASQPPMLTRLSFFAEIQAPSV